MEKMRMSIDWPKHKAHLTLTGNQMNCYYSALLERKVCLQSKIILQALLFKIRYFNQRQYVMIA